MKDIFNLLIGGAMSPFAALTPFADWHGPGWWIVFFPIGWFLFFFLVFFVLRRFAWWGCGRGPGYDRRGWGGTEDATRVLDRRFAEGAIEVEEYRERRATLEG
jgi:putative membrane protein